MPLIIKKSKEYSGLTLFSIIKVCCMNCKYYYATTYKGFCTIDKEIIDVEISHIVKCKAFSEWFGAI